jgi:hypothetical protein
MEVLFTSLEQQEANPHTTIYHSTAAGGKRKRKCVIH